MEELAALLDRNMAVNYQGSMKETDQLYFYWEKETNFK